LWQEVCFGVRDQAGTAAALTKLRADEASGTGWVEDVYTLPAARGRGIARALVTHATNVAREKVLEFTFIVADDNDWPKQLYAKLGFRPVGHLWSFHQRS
jgi:GNAT superfamily N-acetyltransferase